MAMLKNITTEEQVIDRMSNLEKLISTGTFIGNVLFTEEGIVTIKPYDKLQEPCAVEDAYYYQKQLIEDMHTVIKQRMQHCVEELQQHINNEDVKVFPSQVVWTDGSFNIDSYKIMESFSQHENLVILSDLFNMFCAKNVKCICQQILQHLYWCLQNEIVINGLNYTQDELFKEITDLIVD